MKTFLKLFLPFVIITAFSLNAILTIIGWQASSDLDENRSLAKVPEWSGSINSYVRGLDVWINDNFAFRKPMVQAFNSALYSFLRSTMVKSVIIGEGEWIFGADFDGQAAIAQRVLEPGYLERVKQAMAERRAWLNARGMHMLVMFMPSKSTIYGKKYLPWYWRVDDSLPSPSEQVYAKLGKEFRQNIIPVRQSLLNASEERELYYHTDTHATQLGTFIAYQEMAKHIDLFFSDYAPSPYPDFELKPDKLGPTGFGRLMGLPFTDMSLVPVPKRGPMLTPTTPLPDAARFLPKGTRATFFTNPSVKSIRAVLIGDSFTNRMANIFGEVFQDSATLNMNNVVKPEDRFPYAFLDAYRPNFVVFMYVDTRLVECEEGCGEFPISNPPAVRDTPPSLFSNRSNRF